jgi:predicted nucleotidyltransferase component of viral defense system
MWRLSLPEKEPLAMSVRDRLLALARRPGQTVTYNALLRRYLQERFLWRVAQSAHRDHFVLKGGLRLVGAGFTWARATKDIDLLGRGDPDVGRLEAIFREVCWDESVEYQLADGAWYDPESVRAMPTMQEAEYGGVRVSLVASLGTAREPMHVDVGFGDVVTPKPAPMQFPTLLHGMAAPHLLAYNDETTVAEKFETMIRRGLVNSRMKDFYDLARFAHTVLFDGALLSLAVQRTFERRGTAFTAQPAVFDAGFAGDAGKATQWRAFRRSLGMASREAPEQFDEVVAVVRVFIEPVYDACRMNQPFTGSWIPFFKQWESIEDQK